MGAQNGTVPLKDSFGVFLQKLIYSYHTIQQSCSLVFIQMSQKLMASQKNCTKMFIAALFITVKTWKQQRCPSVSEWIDHCAFRQWNIIQC